MQMQKATQLSGFFVLFCDPDLNTKNLNPINKGIDSLDKWQWCMAIIKQFFFKELHK